GAVVLIVSADVPLACTAAGLSAQGGTEASLPAKVQARFTVQAKPLRGTIVMVEVAELPGVIVEGISTPRRMLKSGAAGALTISVNFVGGARAPETSDTDSVETT